ncbi:DUF4288 domain-containing protein [Pedobacter yulinensis]|nr:DUF4288 domain-containing protein [Pedobacter yulinensis]
MKWFAVKYIFRIISGEGKHSPQFDEQTRLLLSADKLNAFEKARSLAGQLNKSFRNRFGDLVSWKFVEIVEINEVANPEDGVEINSTIIEPENVTGFLEEIRLKKNYLSENTLSLNF